MSQNNNQAQGAVVPANKKAELAFIEYKNRVTTSVLNKIGELRKGGITVPVGYAADNQIYLAFLKLTGMTAKDGKTPLLSAVTAQSVANSLLTMCIKGLSLEKGQCAFIQYGNELQLQQEYHGTIALAKRYGAGDPQAQVVYEDDVFEYEINPKTGKKVVTKHEQKLANINKDKIIGAWCLVPYEGHPEKDPKIEVMTFDEIKQAWMQGPTKGQSPAHRNFPGEMCKKTVIGRACKLFISTSDDAGVYENTQPPEWQETRVDDGEQRANAQDAVFTELPGEAPAPEVVKAGAEMVGEATGEVSEGPDVQEAATSEAEAPKPQPRKAPERGPAAGLAGGGEQATLGADFFNV
ncbi:MAG: recombinase RecT [Bacteroidales bacterium]|nr:recombinase RecT [Bacteroidales bacterium]